ncbi:uncharacterized protein LOC118479802 [Helianthus annuus]|uniref:uncharacterized protein LOC118479802 n=1 Tax=Helianthus annuus TaxID=4232 RepID=UPI001652F8A2|nr:uncharacterized protein LOC118479802 [Helianthus annuus]
MAGKCDVHASLRPQGSSLSPPNQAAKDKTVQVWGREQMGLVSNPDTCWLPIQRDGGGTGVQVWDRRRLDMNSDPGFVWYPRQATWTPMTPFRPPPRRFGSPTPQFGSLLPPPTPRVPLRRLWATSGPPPARFRTPLSAGVSDRSKGRQPMTQVWVPKATTVEVTDPDHGCKGATGGSDARGFSLIRIV